MKRTYKCGICGHKFTFNETKIQNPGEHFFRCTKCEYITYDPKPKQPRKKNSHAWKQSIKQMKKEKKSYSRSSVDKKLDKMIKPKICPTCGQPMNRFNNAESYFK